MPTSVMQMGEDSTIRGYSESYDSEEITHEKLFFQQVLEDMNSKKIVINTNTIALRYMKEFKPILTDYEFTESEYRKYRYNPKKLSYDIYGTTELWSLLLDINEVSSAYKFNFRKVKIFPTYIMNRIERIVNLEAENKNYNAEVVSDALNS